MQRSSDLLFISLISLSRLTFSTNQVSYYYVIFSRANYVQRQGGDETRYERLVGIHGYRGPLALHIHAQPEEHLNLSNTSPS